MHVQGDSMTRKQASLTILLLVCALLLPGCAEPYTTDARVTGKHYRAAYTWVKMIPLVSGKVITMVPIVQYEPERWTLAVTWMYNAKQAKRTVDVDQATYDRTAVGTQVQVTVHPGWSVDLAGAGH